MSNELQTSTKENTISSREVAEMLGKEHYDLLKDIEGNGKTVGIIPVLEKGNFPVSNYFIESTYKSGTREYKCYEITKMGCEMLGNKQQGEKGILFTAKYVKRLNEMEKSLKPKLPTTYIEALEQLLASEKEKARVQLELKDEQHKNEMLMHFNKLYTTTEIAKELGIKSAAKLNKVLNDKGIQFKQNGTWVLYSDYSECGYVSIKQTLLENGHIIYDRKWTQEGRKFLLDLLG